MKIPFWVVKHLGQRVQLSKPYRDCIGRTYPAGSFGRLESIQAGRRSAFCTVIMQDDPTEAEDNFQFADIRPA